MLPRNLVRAELFPAPAGCQFDIRNPLSCNILLANSFLARFYADFLRRRAANPCIPKDLEIQSGIFFDLDQLQKNAQEPNAKGFR
jgi:hypothetical protein